MLSDRLGHARPRCAGLFVHLTERWDGKGEPGRLRGDEIPLAVRIIQVAGTRRSNACSAARSSPHGSSGSGPGGAFDPAIAARLADDAGAILAVGAERSGWDETLAAEPAPG